jgi:hypothetical protein
VSEGAVVLGDAPVGTGAAIGVDGMPVREPVKADEMVSLGWFHR